ncbi:MAG: glucokinase [Candidatus Omnitrophica bacterium CG11_big_fil_rev_8_21_14_0_20_63_9]|nr:MAG: glucokinase [Candidatus Omnitrophica bacterium CG11_big_fil_rev_8_21_14_0_20_63_9]
MILAGDVGGTKTNLALCTSHDGRVTPISQRSFPSQQYPGLETILEEFLESHTRDLTGACFGIAGPVVDGRSHPTNLPWLVDVRVLQRTLGLDSVELINDLEATAYGVQTLPEEAFTVLNAGDPQPHGTLAIIAAGTGLGEAALIWNGHRYQAIASEGGHADFAPRNELEMELLRYLVKQFGHASYERLLSGPGKVSIYQFLKETGHGEEPAWLTEVLAHGDPSPVISEMALNGRSELCVKALKLFTSIYGAEAGNLALKYLARGGVYLGGGIAPKMLPLLQDGTFMQAFMDKGRLAVLLSRIPVRVILEERTALYGAASYGWSQVANA